VIARVRIVIFVLGIASILWFLNIPFYQNVTSQIIPITNISIENISDIQRASPMNSILGTESNVSAFQEIRDDKSWQNLTFQSVFDTYVKGGSAKAYGVYESHKSNIFSPGETLYLYIEPVGYTFIPTQSIDKIFSIDLSADFIVSEPSGREVTSMHEIQVSNITTPHNNTELFLVLTITPGQSVSEGDYVLKYIVKDKPTGRTFDIVKEITLAAGLQSRGTMR
jgi:hypothetical protein